MRSLIADVAEAVDGVAHMTELLRTKQVFTCNECYIFKEFDVFIL